MPSNDLELALKVKADIKQAKAELAQLTKEIEKQRAASGKAAGDNAKNSKSLNDLAKSAKSNEQAIGNQISLYRGAAAAIGLYAVAAKVIQSIHIADEFKQIEARVARATRAQGDFNKVWAEVVDISNDNGQAIRTTVSLFEGINRAAPEIKATRDEVLAVTRVVEQLGILSGATGEQMSNSMLQFSQAMAGGIVRAEEMNSIIENTPGIAEAIAKGMGLTVGQLRKAVAEGKILSGQVFGALLKQAPEIGKEFEGVASSIERSATHWANNVARVLTEIDKAIGVTNGIALLIEGNAILLGKVADSLSNLNGSNESDIVKKQRERLDLLRQQKAVQQELNLLQVAASANPNSALITAQVTDSERRVAQLRAQIKAVDAELVALNERANKAGGEGDKGKPGGIPNTLAAAIAAQTKANDQIKGLVDQRQSLLDQLDALSKKLSGPAAIEDQTSSANIFTLNRLRGSAQTKFEKGDATGGLADLERAKSIVEQLAQSGEVSKGYLQTQISLVRELADNLKNNQAEIQVPVKPVVQDDAHVITQEMAKLRAEFERQNPNFKITPEVDGQNAAASLKSHLANLQAIAKANPVSVDVVFKQAGGLGDKFSIQIGGQTLSARSDGPVTEQLMTALREAQAAGGE